MAPTVAFGLALAACDITAPLPDSGVPSALEFSVSGFGYGSRSVVVKGDTILFWRVPPDFRPTVRIDTARVIPSAENWRAFWSAANAAGVNRWRSSYRADGIVDGTGWSLRLVANGRVITSQGSNAYPDRSGGEHEGDFTPEFLAFLAAFEQLIGQKLF